MVRRCNTAGLLRNGLNGGENRELLTTSGPETVTALVRRAVERISMRSVRARNIGSPAQVVEGVVSGRRRAAPHEHEPTPADPFLELVLARTDEVVSELAGVSGDASLCSLSRSGGRVDGAKYLEGRMAVLMELARRRRREASDPSELLGLVGDQWRAELVAARTRDLGPSWIAYRAGGVDEVEELDAAQATGTA